MPRWEDWFSRAWAATEVQPMGFTSACWVHSKPASHGYAMIRSRGRRWRLHVLAFVTYRGQIPEGHEVDHLCRVTRCWRPDHLEAVTHQENARRSAGPAGRWRNTHCVHGHKFTPENTYVSPNGTRHCKRCGCDRAREYYRRRKEAA